MRVVAAILLVLAHASLFAETVNQGFVGGKEEGWFWYKDPKEIKRPLPTLPVAPIPAPTPETPPSAPKKPVTFSVKWLQENLETLREIAIDNPSPENIRAYYYAQRVMLDKSDKFASMSQQVVLSDPFLDENNNFPFASMERTAALRLQGSAKKEGLKHLAEKVGIWFFFDSKCAFCTTQTRLLNHLSEDYGFNVKAISLDGKALPGMENIPIMRDKGQYRALNLTVTPSLVMAVPPKSFLVLSQGALSDDAVDDRILSAAATQHLLPAEINKQIDIFAKGVLATDDLNSDESKTLSDNPAAWMEYLRGRLKNRY